MVRLDEAAKQIWRGAWRQNSSSVSSAKLSAFEPASCNVRLAFDDNILVIELDLVISGVTSLSALRRY